MTPNHRPCPRCNQPAPPYGLTLWSCKTCQINFMADGKPWLGSDRMEDREDTRTLAAVALQQGEATDATIGELAVVIADLHRRLSMVEDFINQMMGAPMADKPRIERAS